MAQVVQFPVDEREPVGHEIATAQHAYEFITAGHALITLQSEKTGVHFTYQVSRVKNSKGQRWFVSVLNGPDNTSNYAYIGLLDQRFDGIAFRQTAKARFNADAPCVRAFAYMWKHVMVGNKPDALTIRHNGRCGRCGRTLTVPESIDRGIGPECWEKMGG